MSTGDIPVNYKSAFSGNDYSDFVPRKAAMKYCFIGLYLVLLGLSGCKTKTPDRCGDGILDPGEECDKTESTAANCYELGYYDQHGVLSCKSDCTFDRSVCGARCGDGFIQILHGEQCDGENISDETCQSLGLGTGSLRCKPNCRFDTAGCEIHAECGDGVVAAPFEACEADNLNSQTCETLGYYGGQLSCSDDCLAFDVSGCAPFGRCGDGSLQDQEECDGTDLDNETCESLGFLRGSLSCGSDCRFDVTGCEQVSDNADLVSITILPGGILSPFFEPAVTAYTATVPTQATGFSVMAEAACSHAEITFDPSTVENIPIQNNPVQVLITVKAEAGNVKTYQVEVSRIMVADIVTPNIGTLRYVPGGTFRHDDNPDNLATVSAFFIGTTEVTRERFLAVAGYDPSQEEKSCGLTDPVQRVNWYDSIVFCNLLSILEGLEPVYSIDGSTDPANWGNVPVDQADAIWDDVQANWTATGYRLPTVMEWTWAAMGATDQEDGYTKPVAGSFDPELIDDYAWYRDNSLIGMHFGTQSVGTKLPNELGLYDMSGNVCDWVWDWHIGGYPNGHVVDYRGPDIKSESRDKRGGSWFSLSTELGLNMWDNVWTYERDNRNGFRVVRRF